MPFRIVQSKQNSRVKELRRALANPGREKGGLAGIEGPNLLVEALRAGLRIHCVFACEGNEEWLERQALSAEIEVLILPREVLRSALTTETPQPIAALVEPPDWTWSDLFGDRRNAAPLIVVLAELQDPGNVGAIIRSAEAFGATGVICLPGTVSAWNPKAVRASAGSIFRVPVMSNIANEAFARLKDSEIKTLAAVAENAQPANLVELNGPVALLIGNEGNGVPKELVAQSDGAITIPCPGPVESLNAAVAASVLLYEASRQRTKGSSEQGVALKGREFSRAEDAANSTEALAPEGRSRPCSETRGQADGPENHREGVQ
jgi:TrmH family RNA methyltransferase